MSDAKSQAEPSMEEILASIRRIISEDAAGGQHPAPSATTPAVGRAAAIPAAEREKEDVLNLTQPLGGDDDPMEIAQPARSIPAAAIKNAALEAPRTMGRPGKTDLDLNFELDASLEADDDASSFEDSSFESGLLSRAAAGAASDALSRLDQAMVAPPSSERPKKPATPSPDFSGGMTIEQLVAETLKPILRDWLNDNLPAMVEEMVQAEIHRLTQSRRR